MAKDTISYEPMEIKAGARPVYGLVFGTYGDFYQNAPGGLAYARGLYRVNFSNKVMLYPEVASGVLYMRHRTEHGRELFIVPFVVNLYLDAAALNFKTPAGTFTLKPYIGLGVYLNHYRSSRTSSTGADAGYQAGINLEYRHRDMKGAYVEISVDHMFVTNFDRYLPMLAFGAGAGYAFDYRGVTHENIHD